MRTTTEITSLTEMTVETSVTVNAPTFMNTSYHEMADQPIRQQDPLEQLQNNLEMLSDLQKRLSFLMREVRYQLKM